QTGNGQIAKILVTQKHKQVFTTEQKLKLALYIKRSREIMFGLIPVYVKRIAYQCANLGLKIKEQEKTGFPTFCNAIHIYQYGSQRRQV
ncbi:hypothetical protein NQ318_023650, partial [Aromia moschata]